MSALKFFVRSAAQLLAAAALFLAAYLLWSGFSPQDLFVDDHKFDAEIAVAAAKYGLDKELVRSLIYQESRFNQFAVGSAGECGLMQLMPGGAAAEWAKVKRIPAPSRLELFEVPVNLEIGCWYLANGIKEYSAYKHRVELALARYNAGPRRTKEWLPKDKDDEVLPRIKLQSTYDYVRKIMLRYQKYTSGAGKPEKSK